MTTKNSNGNTQSNIVVTLNLIEWLTRVNSNLDLLEQLPQSANDERANIMRELKALFHAGEKAGLNEYVDQLRPGVTALVDSWLKVS